MYIQRVILRARNYQECLRSLSVTQESTLSAWRRVYSNTTATAQSDDNDNDTTSSYPHIPKPTWSVKDLQLTAKHPKLPHDELERLAHRALLDLDQLEEDLDQDLANMMHMVEQVSDFVQDRPDLFDTSNDNDDNDYDNNDNSASEIYDAVRGVTSAPLRASSPQEDGLQREDQAQAEAVWDSYLAPNTIRQGGAHEYFSISTKEEE